MAVRLHRGGFAHAKELMSKGKVVNDDLQAAREAAGEGTFSAAEARA
jgi:hypothetical protein